MSAQTSNRNLITVNVSLPNNN